MCVCVRVCVCVPVSILFDFEFPCGIFGQEITNLLIINLKVGCAQQELGVGRCLHLDQKRKEKEKKKNELGVCVALHLNRKKKGKRGRKKNK